MVSVFQLSGNFNSDFKKEHLNSIKKYVHRRGVIEANESNAI